MTRTRYFGWCSLFVLGLVTVVNVIVQTQTACVDGIPKNLNFESYNNKFYLNGDEFHLKGASWFGFETSTYTVDGLWKQPVSFFLDFLANNNFNIVRLPFSVDLINGNYTPGSNINYYKNPQLQGLTSMQVMDYVINSAAQRGLLILLDMHSLEPDGASSNGLWYDTTHNETLVHDTWINLLIRYQSNWNVIGADIFNEPYLASWGDGNNETDFSIWATKMGQDLLDYGANLTPYQPQWINFVQGIAKGCGENACFWGENLENVKDKWITYYDDENNKILNKIVYSPHVYGPGSTNQSYFQSNSFPSNMPSIWDDHWGYLSSNNTFDKYGISNSSVIIGEWGGHYNESGNDISDETVWINTFINYLNNNISLSNQILWCLNANSKKTGGLLQADWTTPDQAHLSMCQQVQPNPTNVTYNNVTNQVCYSV